MVGVQCGACVWIASVSTSRVCRCSESKQLNAYDVCTLPPPPAGNSCRHGNGQMPLSSGCCIFTCCIFKKHDGGASCLAGVRLCSVGSQFLEERSVSSSPALAAVPRKVAGAAQSTAPLSHEEERLACLHLCRQEQNSLLHTMWRGTCYPTHGSIFDSDNILNKQCSQTSPSIKQHSLPDVCFSAQKSHQLRAIFVVVE